MIQDETKGMTVMERTAYYNETAARFLASDKPKESAVM
jgi:hypothetical protein